MDEKFVMAVSKKTGAKRPIPEHWLDHPVLGKGFKLPPSTTGRRTPEPAPTDAVAPPVADVDASPTSAKPGDTDTPAAGGEQEN